MTFINLNGLDHIFQANINANCQQIQYVKLVIYTDIFTLIRPRIVIIIRFSTMFTLCRHKTFQNGFCFRKASCPHYSSAICSTNTNNSAPLKNWSRAISEFIHKVWTTWNRTRKQEILSVLIFTLNFYFFNDRGPYHIKTKLFIYTANQWTAFYMIQTSSMKE